MLSWAVFDPHSQEWKLVMFPLHEERGRKQNTEQIYPRMQIGNSK